MADRPIWLIGCGNMAGAMLSGWIRAGLEAQRFHVIDPAGPDLPEGVQRADAPPPDGFGDAIVQLGFKPYMLADLAAGLTDAVGPDTLLTSIMAGVEIASLRSAFPKAGAIARVMPNLPVALGKGAIGLLPEAPDQHGLGDLGALIDELGQVERLSNERHIDIVTVLSGSGPAFLYRFIDALAEAGADLGLEEDTALRLAIATAEGAAALAASSDIAPGELAERVASPGGTTRAGLDILDEDDAMKALIGETLDRAVQRAEQMARETRG